MKKFVEHIRREATPLILSFAMLPGGGLAQVKTKPEAVSPEAAAALHAEILGRADKCKYSFPKPTFGKEGEPQPYNGLMACSGGSVDFFAIADGLLTAMKSHKSLAPEQLTLEFNVGGKDAKSVTLGGGKLRAIMEEFMKRGIDPDEKRTISIVPSEKLSFQLAVNGDDTIIVVPTAIVSKIPAPRVAELIDNMLETAEKKRNEKPGVTI